MAEMGGKQQSIVMFPFMAQGHIIPFLALALHIQKTQKEAYAITFINTPQNIAKLKSSLPPDASIRFIEIPFNSSDHGLPPNVENSDSLPYSLFIPFLQASASLRVPFRDVLLDLMEKGNGESPLCVVGDIFFGWMGRVCGELGVFHVIFSGAGGFGLGCYYSIWLNLPQRDAQGDDFLLPDFPEAKKIHRTQLNASMLVADGTDAWSIFQSSNLLEWVNSEGILFNTVEELDKIGLLYFKRKLGFPVWAIGPILLPGENRARAGVKTAEIKEWLNKKPDKSVLYVSFGSMNTISMSHMSQLAMALESSGKSFIWVVRPPIGFDINGEFRTEWLPDGFEDRIKESDRGILVEKWAPQVEILAHRSTSAFLSHCGWNSVLESLSQGVPMLGWPMAAEQFFNTKLLQEEIGVCVEVARGKSCEVRHEDIAENIKIVMDDTDTGREMRRRALEVKAMIQRAVETENGVKGSSVKAMEGFLNDAMLKKARRSKTTA